MGQKGRAGIIILVILLILSLVGIAIGFYYFQKERLKVIALNEELDSLKVQRRIAEQKLAESTKRIEELNTQLQLAQTDIQELNSELEQVTEEKDQLNSKIEELQSQVQEQEKVKEEWEAKQKQAQEKINELQALIQALEAGKDTSELQLNKLKTKDEVELGKIVVEQKKETQDISSEELAQTQAQPTLEGKILVLNKEYDFVVINLGIQDGLSLGDLFSVYYQGNYIGNIQVERIQEKMSVCSFVSKGIKDIIEEGKEVVLGKIVGEQKEVVEKEVSPVQAEEVVPSEELNQSQVTSALEGQVLVINKDYDFAIINLGSQDTIDVGDIFSLYHNDSYIGDIRVDKTQDRMSACVFISEDVENKIKEGDKAVKK